MSHVFESMGTVAFLNLPDSSLSIADAEALRRLFDRDHERSSCGVGVFEVREVVIGLCGLSGAGGPPSERTGAEPVAEPFLSITFQTFHSHGKYCRRRFHKCNSLS